MDDHELAGVRAIVARNDAMARDAVGVLYSGLCAQHARSGLSGNSRRWIAIAQLFEDEGRKHIRTTADDVSRLNASGSAFAIVESAFRDFLQFLEDKYFHIASSGRAFSGSRPNPDQLDNPLSGFWWKAKERLNLEIDASRATFSQTPTAIPAKLNQGCRNKGGKPLAEHWDQMWAAIAVQLWQGDLQPKRQADIKRAMAEWLNEQEIDASDTAIVERARRLWQAMEQAR